MKDKDEKTEVSEDQEQEQEDQGQEQQVPERDPKTAEIMGRLLEDLQAEVIYPPIVTQTLIAQAEITYGCFRACMAVSERLLNYGAIREEDLVDTAFKFLDATLDRIKIGPPPSPLERPEPKLIGVPGGVRGWGRAFSKS